MGFIVDCLRYAIIVHNGSICTVEWLARSRMPSTLLWYICSLDVDIDDNLVGH